MTAVVRSLFRTTTLAPQPHPEPGNLVTDNRPILGELGGDCLCGRGQAIGTCIVTANRLWFRAFRDSPAAYHLARVTDWACVDCVADAALDVANGVIRDRMREGSRERAAELAGGKR